MDLKKKQTFLTNFAFYGILFVAGYFILKYALPVLMPFVIAFIIAYALRRPIRAIHRKTGLNRKAAGFITVILFYLVTGLVIFYAGFAVSKGIGTMLENLPDFFYRRVVPVLDSAFKFAEEQVVKIDPSLYNTMEEMFNEFLKSLGSSIKNISVGAIGMISGFAANVPGMLIKILFAVIASIFVTIDYDRFSGFILAQFKGRGRELLFEIKSYVFGTLFVCVRSYATIMAITFVELSVGLSIIGVENSIAVAGLIAIFDILPVLGTGGIMIPWMIIELLHGDIRLAVSLLIVYVIVTVIRNIIEPKIVGGNLGLHPVVTLICMFSGTVLFGVVGLFGFPIALSLIRHLNDTGVIHLYNPVYDGRRDEDEKEEVKEEIKE